LTHGTEEEHLGTITQAKANKVDSVWTGEIRRKRYLAENLAWAEAKGLISVKFRDDERAQMSFFDITYNF
jgi:hypothetical protein